MSDNCAKCGSYLYDKYRDWPAWHQVDGLDCTRLQRDQVREANAALLEACESTYNALGQYMNACKCQDPFAWVHSIATAARDRARAAIAKAKEKP